MKTINKNIDIFDTERKAIAAFDRSLVSCDLLYAESAKSWYIDRSKSALKEWPSMYVLINSKTFLL